MLITSLIFLFWRISHTQKNYTKFVGKSVNAYKRIYPSIAKAIQQGEEVVITYIDYD